MRRVVEEQRLGFVATVSPDGTPNLSPKGTLTVLDDDHLVFADLASPHTIENLRSNPATEVNVVDPVVRKGFRFKGSGTIVDPGELFNDLIATLSTGPRALSDPSRVRHLVVIEVERAQPLVSPAYDSGASEEEVSARWERYFRTLWKSRPAP